MNPYEHLSDEGLRELARLDVGIFAFSSAARFGVLEARRELRRREMEKTTEGEK